MQLREIKGERALDVIAELITPLSEIMNDKNIKAITQSKDRLELIKVLLKDHKHSILTIMALLDGEEPENYEPNIVEIPMKLFNLLNDPDITQLFFSQAQTVGQTQSSSAMANTEAEEN